MANCECLEDWGRVLEHSRHLWPSLNGWGHSGVGGAYYAVPWRDLPHRERTHKNRTSDESPSSGGIQVSSGMGLSWCGGFKCLDGKPSIDRPHDGTATTDIRGARLRAQ